jgi:hypothetical protein
MVYTRLTCCREHGAGNDPGHPDFLLEHMYERVIFLSLFIPFTLTHEIPRCIQGHLTMGDEFESNGFVLTASENR